MRLLPFHQIQLLLKQKRSREGCGEEGYACYGSRTEDMGLDMLEQKTKLLDLLKQLEDKGKQLGALLLGLLLA